MTSISSAIQTAEWGFAVEYSIIYLQEQVKDIGLRPPFDRLSRWSNSLLKRRLTAARKDKQPERLTPVSSGRGNIPGRRGSDDPG